MELCGCRRRGGGGGGGEEGESEGEEANDYSLVDAVCRDLQKSSWAAVQTVGEEEQLEKKQLRKTLTDS